MNKILLLVCLMLFGVLNAQENNSIKYGVGSGVVFSTESNKNSDFFENYRTGITIAGFVQIPLSDKITVQSGLSFIQKGVDHTIFILPKEQGDVIPKIHNPRRTSYLEIPLQVLFRFNENVNISTGLSPAFLLKATRDISFENVDLEELSGVELDEGIDNITNWYKNFDLGLHVGLNLKITEYIFLDARFTRGVLAIKKNQTTFDGTNNQAIQLMLGYQFRRSIIL